MHSFNQWLEEAKKKTLKKENQIYPVSADGIQKGANGNQRGMGDTSDDRTESYVEEGSFVSSTRPNSKPTPAPGSKATNAPKSAKSLQTAANAVVAKNMAASIAAAKTQKDAALKQQQLAKANAAAAKAKAMNPPGSANEEYELNEGRPKKGAETDEGPDKHPINQLRKVISTRGMHHFEHKNGKKSAMNPSTAHSLLAKHDNMKTSAEKGEYAQRIHHSPESLRDVIHGKSAVKKPKVSLGGSKNVGGVK